MTNKEIVISGISGRFPECQNAEEFGVRLELGHDLVTEDSLRWPPGIFGSPKRLGKLNTLKKFDAHFFDISTKKANFMDPQMRILLEVTYEAMFDAGINLDELSGKKAAVYVGNTASETGIVHGSHTRDENAAYALTGCDRGLFANRISDVFNFRGVSMTVDTACSSSGIAFCLGFEAIQRNECELVIIAGSHLTMFPMVNEILLQMGMLSEDGKCKAFDSRANGYARSEAIAALVLQRRSTADRVYATVLGAKANSDGHSSGGLTHPLSEPRVELASTLYAEINVDPCTDVVYVETHGTGTIVGDATELKSIDKTFCKKRKEMLHIGSVKTNMGHSEPASGICSVIKVLLAMMRGMIPPNLHFSEPSNTAAELISAKKICVVTEPTPLGAGSIVAVLNHGYGKTNVHIVLKAPDTLDHQRAEEECAQAAPSFARLILYAGRTESKTRELLSNVAKYPNDGHLHQMIAKQAYHCLSRTPFRGYMVIDGQQRFSEHQTQPEIFVKKVAPNIGSQPKRPIWFIFNGMGSQWTGMAQKLMQIPAFDHSLRESSTVLEEYDVRVYEMLKSSDQKQYAENPLNCALGITAIQIALVDVLRLMGVHPNKVVGHSMGEFCCGYAVGDLTRVQTMRLVYHRGKVIYANLEKLAGAMAAVGLGWEEAVALCSSYGGGVEAACHNGHQSVTISGDKDKVEQIVASLENKNTFARMVDSAGVALHCRAKMSAIEEAMYLALQEHVFNGQQQKIKRLSEKWLSTSVPEERWGEERALDCSSTYFVNNALSPVLFQQVMKKVKPNSITIEIGPHRLLESLLKLEPNLKACKRIGLMNRYANDEIRYFLESVGALYQEGVNVHAESLYPALKGPAGPKTPMIGHWWGWEHEKDYDVIDWRQMDISDDSWKQKMKKGQSVGNGIDTSNRINIHHYYTERYIIDPYSENSSHAYLLDHIIHGRVLYPYSGYIVLILNTFLKNSIKDSSGRPNVSNEERRSDIRKIVMLKDIRVYEFVC